MLHKRFNFKKKSNACHLFLHCDKIIKRLFTFKTLVNSFGKCLKGCSDMATFINVLLIIDAIIMITLIVLQSGTSAGLSGAISGGAEQLFGKRKARGMDLFLHRGTIITAIIFFVLAFVSAYIV